MPTLNIPPIHNISTYNTGMAKSLEDKLFFLDYIPKQGTLVDYGCADGAMLEQVQHTHPGLTCIGYDTHPGMVALANTKRGVSATTELPIVPPGQPTTLVLSSVLHEIYTFGTVTQTTNLWDYAFTCFDYVVIRDFFWSGGDGPEEVSEGTLTRLYRALGEGGRGYLATFEEKWGSIKTLRNLTHFLLKIPYQENWARELEENYFSLPMPTPPANFEIIHLTHYSLPYHTARIAHDYDLPGFDHPTHMKMILKRKF